MNRLTIIPEKFRIHTTTTTCLRTEPIITTRMGVWTLTALRPLYVGPLSHNITPENAESNVMIVLKARGSFFIIPEFKCE